MTEETPGVPAEPDVPQDAEKAENTAATGAAAAAAGGPGADPSEIVQALEQETERLRKQLGERTLDLQRLQAEYQNYRKRVERDRDSVKEEASATVLADLLPVLDDIGRAREHGELVGGFKSVAESTEAAAGKLGLQKYGEEGDPFDPTIHEALMHSYSADVTETVCVQVMQPGYRLEEKVLRPARVAVAEPQPGTQPSAEQADEEAGSDAEAAGQDGNATGNNGASTNGEGASPDEEHGGPEQG